MKLWSFVTSVAFFCGFFSGGRVQAADAPKPDTAQTISNSIGTKVG